MPDGIVHRAQGQGGAHDKYFARKTEGKRLREAYERRYGTPMDDALVEGSFLFRDIIEEGQQRQEDLKNRTTVPIGEFSRRWQRSPVETEFRNREFDENPAADQELLDHIMRLIEELWVPVAPNPRKYKKGPGPAPFHKGPIG